MSQRMQSHEKRHAIILTVLGIFAFAALSWGAVSVGIHQGGGANVGRALSWVIAISTMVWMGWVIWHRDSKARWLSLAIIMEWLGVAMLYLPSVELEKPNGFCIPALEVGKSLELAGLFFGLTATIWLGVGAWLIKKERSGLEDKGKPSAKLRLMTGLIASAHQQVSLGLLTAIIGAAVTCASPAWEVYSKISGIEEPKEQACNSGRLGKRPSKLPESKRYQPESG